MSRSLRLHLVLLLAGAGLVLWGSSLAWITWTQPDNIALNPLHRSRSGADLQPLMRALGFVALAAVPALLALSPRVRRGFAASVGLGCGVGVAASALNALAYRRHPRLVDLASAVGCDLRLDCVADRAGPEGGPALVLVGSLLLVLAGVLAAWHGHTWAGLGASYEAPGAAVPEPVTDKGVWDALDRGDDPTA